MGTINICDCCLRDTFREGEKFFEINDIGICSTCITMVHEYITKPAQQTSSSQSPGITMLTPRQIIQILNENVIKQEHAKEKLAIAVAQHIRRVANPDITYKANVLMYGPTGSGKTELAKAIASAMQVPFVEVDCSQYSPTGYVGDSPSSMIERLLIASNYDVKKAENGIVFLDEIDKISMASNDGREFKSKSVQQEILKLVEGTQVMIKTPQAEYMVDTSKILFFAAGAFSDLAKMMDPKVEKEISIMPTKDDDVANKPTWQKRVTPQDLIKYGIMPELLGRFPILTYTEELSVEDLVDILVKPKNSVVNQLSQLLQTDNIIIEFDHEVLKQIAKTAKTDSLGARSLKRSAEELLAPVFLDLEKYSGKSIRITTNGIVITKQLRLTEAG